MLLRVNQQRIQPELFKRFIKKILSRILMKAKLCQATKKRIENDPGSVVFKCHQCGEHEIIRSGYARRNAIEYTCACGFVGPN